VVVFCSVGFLVVVWFEAFPMVYVDIHHFSLGASGLPFLGLMVGCLAAGFGYICWNYFYVEPHFKATGVFVPESRLSVALFASAFIPVSLLIFGMFFLSLAFTSCDSSYCRRLDR